MNAVSGPMSNRNGLPETSPGSALDRGTRAVENRVVAANVDFYRQVACKYDSYETYLFDTVLQQCLEEDLDKINSYFVSLGRAPSCLECGGGTGNLTLKMSARGWAVTVVDISEEMLDLLKKKACTRGYSPTLIRSPIERYLETTGETFDLVAFSAVLHHLYSYTSVVEQAASHVRAGGLFYSNRDPTVPKWPSCTWAFDWHRTPLAKDDFNQRSLARPEGGQRGRHRGIPCPGRRRRPTDRSATAREGIRNR